MRVTSAKHTPVKPITYLMTPSKIDLPESYLSKMRGAGLGEAAIACFASGYQSLLKNETGMMAEDEISPETSLPSAADISSSSGESEAAGLLGQTVVIKLNGGLGTGMGLESAKSLLMVKGEESFLDLIARQILHARGKGAESLRFSS